MRDYFPELSPYFPNPLDISLMPCYNSPIQLFTVSSQIQRIDAYTLVNMRMTIYNKIRGRTPNPPRRPASADLTMDTMAMEGTGYTHPDRRWPNGAHPKTADYARIGVPLKSYKDWDPGPRRHLLPTAPACPVCGSTCTSWGYEHSGKWWCHFCAAKIDAVYGPLAMLPEDTGEYLTAPLSDKLGKLVCQKCHASMLPRSDNQGYDCPTCQAHYRNPAPIRPGPNI